VLILNFIKFCAAASLICLALAIFAVRRKAWRRALLATALALALPMGLLPFRGVDAEYFPKVLAAVDQSAPDERERLLTLWAKYRYVEGSIGHVGLHQFLRDAGYCSNIEILATTGCTPLPEGDEAQGIAKDELWLLTEKRRR